MTSLVNGPVVQMVFMCLKQSQVLNSAFDMCITVEPPNKGHFGANSFVPCTEVVPMLGGRIIH